YMLLWRSHALGMRLEPKNLQTNWTSDSPRIRCCKGTGCRRSGVRLSLLEKILRAPWARCRVFPMILGLPTDLGSYTLYTYEASIPCDTPGKRSGRPVSKDS